MGHLTVRSYHVMYAFQSESKLKRVRDMIRAYSQKHVDLLLIGEEGKRHYVLIKDSSTFMYDCRLYHEKKTFFVFIVYKLLV